MSLIASVLKNEVQSLGVVVAFLSRPYVNIFTAYWNKSISSAWAAMVYRIYILLVHLIFDN
jgi:hypothetical protein